MSSCATRISPAAASAGSAPIRRRLRRRPFAGAPLHRDRDGRSRFPRALAGGRCASEASEARARRPLDPVLRSGTPGHLRARPENRRRWEIAVLPEEASAEIVRTGSGLAAARALAHARGGRARARRRLHLPLARRRCLAPGPAAPRRRCRPPDPALHGPGYVRRHPRRGEPRLEARARRPRRRCGAPRQLRERAAAERARVCRDRGASRWPHQRQRHRGGAPRGTAAKRRQRADGVDRHRRSDRASAAAARRGGSSASRGSPTAG